MKNTNMLLITAMVIASVISGSDKKSYYKIAVDCPPPPERVRPGFVGVGLEGADVFLINGTDTLKQVSKCDRYTFFEGLEIGSEWTLLVTHKDFIPFSKKITILKIPINDAIILSPIKNSQP